MQWLRRIWPERSWCRVRCTASTLASMAVPLSTLLPTCSAASRSWRTQVSRVFAHNLYRYLKKKLSDEELCANDNLRDNVARPKIAALSLNLSRLVPCQGSHVAVSLVAKLKKVVACPALIWWCNAHVKSVQRVIVHRTCREIHQRFWNITPSSASNEI